jgi:hypothetical protein
VAEGLERCHPKCGSQSQRLSVDSLGWLDGGRVVLSIDLAEEAQAPGLMAAFLVGTGKIERAHRERHGLIDAAGQQIGLA